MANPRISTASRSAHLSASSAASLLAHQGGWDEILLVAGPIAVIVLLLTIVKRRIDAHTISGDSSVSNESGDVDESALDGRADPA